MSPKIENRPVTILLVEDNSGDVRLILEAFKEANVTGEIHSVLNSHDAIHFLRKEGAFSSVQTPDIVILDLNLPGKGGIEVLAEIKSDPVLKIIPVVVLSGSSGVEDITKSYELGANCYIVKRFDASEFIKVFKAVTGFWITIVTLPS